MIDLNPVPAYPGSGPGQARHGSYFGPQTTSKLHTIIQQNDHAMYKLLATRASQSSR
jgi:hypothetical protein